MAHVLFHDVLIPLLLVLLVVVPVILAVAFYVYWERKVIGWMHVRMGPNKIGPLGLAQTFADVFKLLLKEVVAPSKSSRFLFFLAPVLAVAPAFAAWAVIPFSDGAVIANANAGVLYLLAMTSLGVYGILLAGWASNSRYPLLGAMRGAAQVISYELAMGMALVCVLLLAGSLNLTDIVHAQAGGKGLFSWFWLPLLPMFVIYFVSGVAETNRAPFDVTEGESEIVAGHMVEYSGAAFALFFLAEYTNMITVSFLCSLFFMGGWLSPVQGWIHMGGPGWISWLWNGGWPWLFIKALFFATTIVWFRASFPRYRYDQIMRLGWKVFIPIAIVWILVTGGLKYLGWAGAA